MKIITVTLNPCIDVSYNMAGSFKAGELNRVDGGSLRYSGKGINVSRRLKSLGTESLILTFSFGEDGDKMEKALREEGLSLWGVKTEGKLRRNVAILDGDGVATEINEKGSPVSEDKIKELVGILKAELNCPDKKVLIISGSLPTGVDPDVYRRLCTVGRNSNALVVLDCDGEALRCGLKATPDLIKPNRRELEELTGVDLSGHGEDVRIEAVKACLEFFRNEDTAVLCTLDSDGAVYAGPDGSFMCDAVKGKIKSFKGAGDSFLASFIREIIVKDGDCEMALIKAAAETTACLSE
jgi:1-phosphofructokinase